MPTQLSTPNPHPPTPDSQSLFQTAIQQHQAGQFQQAETLYRQVLQEQPDQVEALHLLGVLLHQTGQHQAAVELISTAIALKPDYPEAMYNLGLALQEQGQLEEAIAYYEKALNLKPDYLDAHNNVGNILKVQGKFAEAIASYQKVIDLKADYPKVYFNLGTVFQQQNRVAESAACYHRAIQIQPDYPEARRHLNTLVQRCKSADLLIAQTAEAHYALGILLHGQNQIQEATAYLRQAIHLKPDYPAAYKALAVTLVDQQNLAEAIACYQRAIHLQPDYVMAHTNLGWVLLLAGRYEEGWVEYEWRLRLERYNSNLTDAPQWDGSPLKGKTILLHTEQGLGDTIQFIRYAPRIAALGGRVIVRCQPALVSLLRSAPGIDQVFGRTQDVPAFNVHCPLLSVPKTLRTTLHTIPAQVPYLFPSKSGVKISTLPGTRLTVGIAWASGYFAQPGAYETYLQKSCSLALFLRLLDIPGVTLYSLQIGRDAAAIDAHKQERLQDLSPQLKDFAATASAIAQLDLIISVDTAVVHLAGALAKPVWVLLPFAPDWRWMIDRDDSPWYPTMRLFRQQRLGDWEEVIDRIVEAIQSLEG
ncbi:MAG: tetratricopeptide repeat protein [Cyanobacteria bacterium CRU_2_1]|nr:tetratricopeptide repeat protein [Cyanobacteria bacterium RU_5_0]NJR60900.1 tetratricopeptide repeat protein [Cyanobacteria bacterium CRU_2_1]